MKTEPLKWGAHNSIRLALAILALSLLIETQPPTVQAAASVRRVNVPYLTNAAFVPAIFWFGKVDNTNNYTDVRICYYDEAIVIYVHVLDHRLWADTTKTVAQMAQWDGVSIYLNQDGNTGSSPGNHAFRFDIQVNNNLQAAYKGNGSSWITSPISITSDTAWRGATPNTGGGSDGYVAHFEIPFTSLGLTAAPSQGTQWGLGVIVHDRDDAAGTILQDTTWPETLNANVSSTWGQLSFGWPVFSPVASLNLHTVLIRQGVNGATVPDGAVGGYTTCGNNGADKWNSWGNFNYAGYTQFNIQNQWDVSDWPCFSKYYITFPLTSLPSGQSIVSANLTLSLFGTAGGGVYGPPPDSYIEVFTVNDDWNASTITWNNAPLASENISVTYVPPAPANYKWDVGKAVLQAYKTGQPLRLAIYSIDGDRSSGKYFFTSESNDWSGTVRPTLNVTYGTSCDSPGIICHKSFVPMMLH